MPTACAMPGTEVGDDGMIVSASVLSEGTVVPQVVMLAQIANEVRTPIGRYARAMQRPVLTQQTAYALGTHCPVLSYACDWYQTDKPFSLSDWLDQHKNFNLSA